MKRKRILKIEVKRMADPYADTSYMEQEGFEDRLESYRNGDFGFIGIRAEAEVQFGFDVVQILTSGGLWGIEDDSGAEYLRSVEAEEVSELRATLYAAGFSRRAIAAAVREFVS